MARFMRRVALGTLMAVAIGVPAMAQIMVMRAQGPSAGVYRAGTLLPANRPLVLRAGDHVTLLEGGGTRQFDGPGSFLPQGPSAQARGALVALFSHNPPPPSRLGAARGLASEASAARPLAPPANIWQIDVASPGDFCVAAGQPVELWRRDTNAASIVITRMSDNGKRTLAWPAGAASLEWPADLPLTDGEAYLVWTSDGMDAGVIWRAVDAPSGDWTGFAGQLLQKGCFAQLDTLRVALDPTNSP
jgi:hypothetical protein